jgi:hypothetical protein
MEERRTMPTREILHEIVNKLPEAELLTAARIVTALEQPADPVRIALANAPLDDEEDDDDFDGGLTEALAETAFVPHDEVVRRFVNEGGGRLDTTFAERSLATTRTAK